MVKKYSLMTDEERIRALKVGEEKITRLLANITVTEQALSDDLLFQFKNIKTQFYICICLCLTAITISSSFIVHSEYLSTIFWIHFICILGNLYTISGAFKQYRDSKKEFELLKLKKVK